MVSPTQKGIGATEARGMSSTSRLNLEIHSSSSRSNATPSQLQSQLQTWTAIRRIKFACFEQRSAAAERCLPFIPCRWNFLYDMGFVRK